MKTFFSRHSVREVLFIGALLFIFAFPAEAATRTWDGDGGDSNWSTCANWSSNTCPTSADLAVFDATSTKNATIDASFTGSLLGLSIQSGYTGTITQSRTLTLTTSGFSQSAGIFTSGTQTIDINDGSFTISGGEISSSGGTMTTERGFTYSGGTISGTKTLTFDGSADADDTMLSCSGAFPWDIGISKTVNTALLTVGLGCTIDVVSVSGGQAGSLTINGAVNFDGPTTVSLGTLVNNGALDMDGVTALTTSGSFTNTATITNNNADLNINNGDFSNSGTMSIGGTLQVERNFTNTGTLNYSGTITFDGPDNADDTTLTCSGAFPWDIGLSKTVNTAVLTVNSGCIVNIVNISGSHDGSLTNDGTITFDGPTSFPLGHFVNNGSMDVSGITSITTNGNFTNTATITNNSADLNVNNGNFSNSGTMSLVGTFQVERNFTNTGTLNYSGTIVFDGPDDADDTSLSCSGAFPWDIGFSKSDNTALLTVGSGCSVNIVSITGSDGSLTNNGTVNFDGPTSFPVGHLINNGTLDFTGVSSISTFGSFTNTGTITNNTANLNINSGNLTNSGTMSLSGTLNIERNFTNSGTFNYDGTITFDGSASSADSILTCGTLSASVDVLVAKTSSSADFTFGGNCTVNDFTYGGSTGTFSNPASSYVLTVSGDLSRTNSANQVFGGSNLSVVMTGTDQALTGSMTLYNLTKTAVSAASLTPQAGTTLTISHNLTLQGAPSNLITLNSSTGNSSWNLSVGGTADLDYLNVQYATASPTVTCTNCFDSGNNSGIIFISAPVVSSLGSPSLTDGSSASDTTPTLTAALSDSDEDDTVQYQIQIDDSADFGSPVVDYTSALGTQGSISFTVGQAAGTGNYTEGSASQTLAEGSYYWRLRATDDGGLASDYVTANEGAIAFIVDTTAPSVSITNPVEGAGLTLLTTLTGTATDAVSSIEAVAVALRNSANQYFNGAAFTQGSIYWLAATTSDAYAHWQYTLSSTLADGVYLLYARATDEAENTALSSGLTFTLTAASDEDDGEEEVVESEEEDEESSKNTIEKKKNRPAGLTATYSEGRIFLTWLDQATHENGYILERSTGGRAFLPIASLKKNATKYIDDNIFEGERYTYRLRAYHGNQYTPFSEQVTLFIEVRAPSLTVANLENENKKAADLLVEAERGRGQVATEEGVSAVPPSSLEALLVKVSKVNSLTKGIVFILLLAAAVMAFLWRFKRS